MLLKCFADGTTLQTVIKALFNPPKKTKYLRQKNTVEIDPSQKNAHQKREMAARAPPPKNKFPLNWNDLR